MSMIPPGPDFWKNRRRMAWLSLWSLVLGGGYALRYEVGVNAATFLVGVAWLLGLIVIAYITSATADDIAKMKR
jgi:hypothetical protein